MMNETLGKMHFWLSFIFMNGVFFPMLIQGLAGVSRRLYDQTMYAQGAATQDLAVMMSTSAWLLGATQLIFIFNFFWSMRGGKPVESDNPWQATTLEWATPTPPPHGNFTTSPQVYRGPYEYSVPGAAQDFCPQNES
jgi:cytochrome c oxidase subunit 1